jgi:hypothetical protein
MRCPLTRISFPVSFPRFSAFASISSRIQSIRSSRVVTLKWWLLLEAKRFLFSTCGTREKAKADSLSSLSQGLLLPNIERLNAAESLDEDASDEQAMAKSSTSMISRVLLVAVSSPCIARRVPLSVKWWSCHSWRRSFVVLRLRIRPACCTSSSLSGATGGSGRC